MLLSAYFCTVAISMFPVANRAQLQIQQHVVMFLVYARAGHM